ncbi:MAG: hypothetical protein ABR881_13510 [Candidatus Sulfotelmatobacter sp.]|jgi:hypothetical protein
MLPFVLYFVTGVVTGFHVYALLSFVIYGVPVNPLELVSLLGSFCLLIAAYGSLFRPRAAGRLALIACLAMWCFYAPAIANFVRARVRKPAAVSQLMSPHTGATPRSVSEPESARF